MRYLLFVLLTVNNYIAWSQKSCNCLDMAKTVIRKLESDYVDRENLYNNKQFWQLKKQVEKKTIPNSLDSCTDLLYKIVSSFRDSHITFAIDGDFTEYMRYVYDSATLTNIHTQYLNASGSSNSIEGIWGNEGGEQEFIIKKASNSKPLEYNVILWSIKNNLLSRGQLKGVLQETKNKTFIYKTYSNGKTMLAVKLEKKGNKLFSMRTGYWKKKQIRGVPDPLITLTPHLKVQSDSVIILTMPSFGFEYKTEIDSILEKNNHLLSKTKYLIVDLKVNYGGTTRAYEGFIKWLYTNPIRIESGLYYSSSENIKSLKDLRSDSGTKAWSSEQRLIEQMEKSPNTLVTDSGYYLRYDSIYEYPKKIIVLVGNRCVSAGELFLITAKQSKKVVLLGENSYGSIDRADVTFPEHSCSNLRFSIPIALRKPEYYKQRIDNIGIPPDIRIPGNTDWIQFALDYIKKIK
jgi:Peptidase family S41